MTRGLAEAAAEPLEEMRTPLGPDHWCTTAWVRRSTPVGRDDGISSRSHAITLEIGHETRCVRAELLTPVG